MDGMVAMVEDSVARSVGGNTGFGVKPMETAMSETKYSYP